MRGFLDSASRAGISSRRARLVRSEGSWWAFQRKSLPCRWRWTCLDLSSRWKDNEAKEGVSGLTARRVYRAQRSQNHIWLGDRFQLTRKAWVVWYQTGRQIAWVNGVPLRMCSTFVLLDDELNRRASQGRFHHPGGEKGRYYLGVSSPP